MIMIVIVIINQNHDNIMILIKVMRSLLFGRISDHDLLIMMMIMIMIIMNLIKVMDFPPLW